MATVRIVRPRAETVLVAGAQVRYEVEVLDPGEASSKRRGGVTDEPGAGGEAVATSEREGGAAGEADAANDIVVEVRLFDDVAKATAAGAAATAVVKQGDSRELLGLQVIQTSDCFNCHAFSSRLSGPSFREISRQYVGAPGSAAALGRHIREGNSGKWGKAVMPPHPQVTEEQASAIVAWILEAGADMTRNYYVGREGSFRVDVPPQSSEGRSGGALMLTATYIGRVGLEGQAGRRRATLSRRIGWCFLSRSSRRQSDVPRDTVMSERSSLRLTCSKI